MTFGSTFRMILRTRAAAPGSLVGAFGFIAAATILVLSTGFAGFAARAEGAHGANLVDHVDRVDRVDGSDRSVGAPPADASAMTAARVARIETREAVPLVRSRAEMAIPLLLSSPSPRPTRLTSRERRVWSQTQNGVITITSSGKLHIKTRGAVVVTGDTGSGVRYALVKRVKSRTQPEAQRHFGQYKVRTGREGDTAVLEIVHAGEDGQSAELTVQVPATLRDVFIETHGGSVFASRIDGAVKAETGGGRMALDDIGGAVTALTAGGEITLGNLRGSIQCKSAGGAIAGDSVGGDADLETAGGDIVVGEVHGAVRAATAGGGIHIGRAGATVTASTAGGSIDIGSARGSVSAKNNGGPIQIGGADNVRCETLGGAIRLSKVSGSLNAWTGVGSIFANLLAGGRLLESSLATGGGDITVYIPANVPLTIRAENGSSGSVKTIVSDDFPGIAVRTVGRVAVAEGKVHGGGPLLKLSATGGTIFIKRQTSKESNDSRKN